MLGPATCRVRQHELERGKWAPSGGPVGPSQQVWTRGRCHRNETDSEAIKQRVGRVARTETMPLLDHSTDRIEIRMGVLPATGQDYLGVRKGAGQSHCVGEIGLVGRLAAGSSDHGPVPSSSWAP